MEWVRYVSELNSAVEAESILATRGRRGEPCAV